MAICVVNEHVEVQYETKVEADVQRIVTCLRSFSAKLKVVGFEAGTLTQYLTYLLRGRRVWEKPRMSAALASAPKSELSFDQTVRAARHPGFDCVTKRDPRGDVPEDRT